MLAAKSPSKPNAAIDCLLAAVCSIFCELSLQINFEAGKTEMFVKYRGRNSSEAQKALRDAKYVSALPPWGYAPNCPACP